MTLQTVTTVELDGQIGVLPSGTRALAIIGPADAGPMITPAAFARTQDILSNFTGGLMPEAACWHIQTKQLPVLVERCAASTASSFDTVNSAAKTGTSAVTISGTSNDDYEIYVLVTLGGTIGTGPITIQTSLDGGRTLAPAVALGTANTYTLPNSGGAILAFGAGTLVTGDVIQVRAHPASATASDMTAALNALAMSNIDWEIVLICGPLTTTVVAAITTFFAGQPERCWVGGVDLPSSTQTEATYASTLLASWASVSDSFCVGLLAGAARYTNAGVNPGRLYAKPPATLYASLLASVQEHIDISALNLKPIPGTYIADVNGNPVSSGILLHDERLFPSLDSARFSVLQSKDGRAGVFFCNPNTFATQGSDFQYAQHRRVMNKLKRTLRLYLELRLSVPILVSASTGFILESEALEIESGANAACSSALVGQVSGGGFANGQGFLQLSRTDNLLSTKTLNANGAAVPLAYPKAIILDVGYKNPALRVQAVPGT